MANNKAVDYVVLWKDGFTTKFARAKEYAVHNTITHTPLTYYALLEVIESDSTNSMQYKPCFARVLDDGEFADATSDSEINVNIGELIIQENGKALCTKRIVYINGVRNVEETDKIVFSYQKAMDSFKRKYA